jgi:hypothetical protein
MHTSVIAARIASDGAVRGTRDRAMSATPMVTRLTVRRAGAVNFDESTVRIARAALFASAIHDRELHSS